MPLFRELRTRKEVDYGGSNERVSLRGVVIGGIAAKYFYVKIMATEPAPQSHNFRG